MNRDALSQLMLHTMLHSDEQPNSGGLAYALADAVLASGVVADVRRAVAEEIYNAGEGRYGSHVVASYEAAKRIAREVVE